MDLYILNGPAYPGFNPSYRGVDRDEPTYCDSLPADHEINRLFRWYIEPDGGGPVRDLAKARRYTKLCNMHFSGRHFEIIEVTGGKTPPETGGRCIGFDLFGYGGSLIAMGALKDRGLTKRDGVPRPVLVLSEVVAMFFRPKLNASGLFSEFETASFCLQALDSLQRLWPSLYESEKATDLSGHEVVGIHLVPER